MGKNTAEEPCKEPRLRFKEENLYLTISGADSENWKVQGQAGGVALLMDKGGENLIVVMIAPAWNLEPMVVGVTYLPFMSGIRHKTEEIKDDTLIEPTIERLLETLRTEHEKGKE